ncbi:hypothetical protein Tco_0672922 [Tanacetum coccineum]
MNYIHTTEAELGKNLDIPLSKQIGTRIDKLNDLTNKKRKHADDIHDYFKANKSLKSSVQYKDHLPGTMLNEPVLGMIMFNSYHRQDFVTIEDLKDLSNTMLYTIQEIFFRRHQGHGLDDHARTFSSLLLFESLKLLQRQLFKSLEDWEVSSLRCMQRRFTRQEKDCFMSKGIKQSPWEMLLLKVGIEVHQLFLKDCTCLSSKEITPQLSFNHLAIPQASCWRMDVIRILAKKMFSITTRQYMSVPKKCTLKIGQSSAFLTYVKLVVPTISVFVAETTPLLIIHEEPSLRGDVAGPTVSLFGQTVPRRTHLHISGVYRKKAKLKEMGKTSQDDITTLMDKFGTLDFDKTKTLCASDLFLG